jgi:hypothetical protein
MKIKQKTIVDAVLYTTLITITYVFTHVMMIVKPTKQLS